MNNLNIDLLKILYLSIYLIPNLTNVILPFIIIFGLILAFIKLDRDKEIIAVYSLGISINEIIKPIKYISILFLLIYIFLNFFLSPLIYEKYKEKEFNLRNLIDFNEINLSNFIEIDKNIILDFTKKNNSYQDIFLNYKTENESIIYAKKGKIIKKNGEFIFNLFNGYRLNLLEKKIEKLEFETYNIKLPVKKEFEYINTDKNTLTIFSIIKDKNYKLLIEKIFENIILLSLIIFFYIFNLKENNFKTGNIIKYLIICILILVINNLIKNLNSNIYIYIIMNLINISIFYFCVVIRKFKIL